MKSIQSIFPQLESELLKEIEEHAIIKTFEAGEILMRTGQYIKSTMLIVEGQVKVFRESEDGGEYLMYYINPGEGCALSFICAAKVEASKIMAKTMEETTVLMIPIQYMDSWMNKYKSWYYFVLETYRNRFDELLVLIDNIAFKNMDERLEYYLQKHIEVTGSKIIHLSHQQIATELNSSREVISRLLKKMEQIGYVKLSRNEIEWLR